MVHLADKEVGVPRGGYLSTNTRIEDMLTPFHVVEHGIKNGEGDGGTTKGFYQWGFGTERAMWWDDFNAFKPKFALLRVEGARA